MRLGGLASGMDTDQMVKELMKAENVKVDRVEADKQILEWKKEALNSLNKDLANFVLDSKKDLGYNSLGRSGTQDWAKSATSTNDDIGTAKAGQGAFEGKHTVEVTKLAKGVTGVSKEPIENKDWKATSSFEFELNGEKIKVEKNDTFETIARKISNSGAKINASYDKNLGAFFLSTKNVGEESKIEFKAIGDAGQLNDFLGNLNMEITNGTQTQDLIVGDELRGKKGKVKYNGFEADIDSNQPTFNGVRFDLKAEGPDAKFTVDVKTDADTIVDKVKSFVENYNKLIEQANTLIKEKQNRNYRPLTAEQREAMSDKEVELWDKKAKSGVARGDMDIERMLSALRTDLYKNLEGATGKFINISQIGITTQGYEAGSAGGKLQIDEDKLRKAISEDADSVLEVLFKEKSSTKSEGETKANSTDSLAGTSDKGLFSRIFDNITDGMKSLIEKSGPGEDSALFRKVKSTIMTDFVTKGGKYSGKGSISDIDDDMLKFTKRIDDLKMQLFRKENMYYARFTAMEKAMQRANSQGDWLMQQMM